MNITDVWHLTDDADFGEDKMEKWSKREWVSAWDIAKKYTTNFKSYMKELGITFDAFPKATNFIKEQIAIVKDLQEKGYTYAIPGDWIYMDTSKVDDYGKLLWSNYKEALAGLEAWCRVEGTEKRNTTDFALWKFSPSDEQRQMERIFDWDRTGVLIDGITRNTLTAEEQSTRWFPWWHIECSAMSRALLGEHFDIHTGWVDHISVHHSNEIAQSEASFCSHKPWVNYRLHCQFLNINGAKVSKSAWDDLSLPWLQQKDIDPLDLRLFFFTGQYRNFLDFTREWIYAAKTTRQNMIKKIYTYVGDRIVRFYNIDRNDTNNILFMQFTKPLLDDMDTPKFLATIQKALGNINDEVLKTILYIDRYILRIGLYDGVVAYAKKEAAAIPENIRQLAIQRREARQAKDFATADKLRDQLYALWRIARDGADTRELERLEG